MSEFSGKTVVVSGGAEGIGFAIARSMGQQGMNVVIGDIDVEQLENARATLEKENINVLAVPLDVVQLSQWQHLAEQAIARFDKIHMLVNNAGVGSIPGSIEKTNNKEWDWVIDVNLSGVLHGAQTIVPLMKQHQEKCWLLNVASMAGMIGVPSAGVYTCTKAAVVSISESWQVELKPHNIDVSVLCPSFVQTRINRSHRNKPADVTIPKSKNKTKPSAAATHMQQVINNGLPPEIVAQRVIEAINNNEFYIFTHPNYREMIQQRFARIDAAFERAAASPLLTSVLDQEVALFN